MRNRISLLSIPIVGFFCFLGKSESREINPINQNNSSLWVVNKSGAKWDLLILTPRTTCWSTGALIWKFQLSAAVFRMLLLFSLLVLFPEGKPPSAQINSPSNWQLNSFLWGKTLLILQTKLERQKLPEEVRAIAQTFKEIHALQGDTCSSRLFHDVSLCWKCTLT